MITNNLVSGVLWALQHPFLVLLLYFLTLSASLYLQSNCIAHVFLGFLLKKGELELSLENGVFQELWHAVLFYCLGRRGSNKNLTTVVWRSICISLFT